MNVKEAMNTKAGKTLVGLGLVGVGVATGQAEIVNLALSSAGLEFGGCIDTLYKIGSLVVGWL